jgi:hypothetical protein
MTRLGIPPASGEDHRHTRAPRRKYNGEWLPADGPLPFVLSGWEVEEGKRIYEGYLLKDGQTVSANPGGSHTSIIIR